MKILCIGHASYDTTIPMCGFLEENTKLRIDTKFECGGGPACNAAYLLGKWGLDTTFVGVVGNDKYGNYIKKELDEVNVNTRYMRILDGYETTSSIIFANVEAGTRTIVSYRPGEAEKLKTLELDFTPDIILVDGHEFELSKNMIEKYPNAISIMDAGRVTEDNLELAKIIDYVVCSKEFAETVTNVQLDGTNYDILYQKMKEIFSKNIIVTLEEKGCLYEYEGALKIMPSIEVKSIDSTGAGDIFHGAFTYGIAMNWDLEKILKFANVTAGLSVTKIGSRNSIFDYEEIRKKYDEEFE
jgi:sugar/nucleoside kinase (ribokinase family)